MTRHINDTAYVCTQINWIFFLENPLFPGYRVCLLIVSQHIKLPLEYEGILKSPPASNCLINYIPHYRWSERTCVSFAKTWCTGLSLPQLDSHLILTPTVIAHPSSGHSLGAGVLPPHCNPLKPPLHSTTHHLLVLSKTKHLLSPLLSLSPNSHPLGVMKKSYKKSLFGFFFSLLTKNISCAYHGGKVKSQRISTVLLMTMILAKSLNPFKYPFPHL